MNYNQKFFLCWKDTPVSGGKISAGRQEIVKDEWHSQIDREVSANQQAETMNSIYGEGSHWIEVE